MRIRIVLTLVVLLAGVLPAIPTQADDFLLSIGRDFKRRNCWPEPFVCPDRQAVREPSAIMIARGWERQNMLYDQYFEDGQHLLTEAGRLKIHWILTEAPSQHRVVYVRRSDNPQETFLRLEAVRAYAVQVLAGQQLPPILETSLSPPGWPADRVDVQSRKFYAAIPDPVLPSASGGSSGGTSGAK